MADLEAEEREEDLFGNLMWLRDGRLIEARMTFENIRKAYDRDFRGRFQVVLPKYVKPPVKPWHIFTPLEIIEVITELRGY